MRGRAVDLEHVTVPIVADYLLFLFNDRELSYPTISSHRSAISDALPCFDGYKIGEHPVLSNLLRNFRVARPPVRNRVPDWDLSVVLRKLVGPDFEPPRWDTALQRQRATWKTVFLLALASSKRASELHALSRDKGDIVFSQSAVHLRTVPGFLPKNQRLFVDPAPFAVPSLEGYAGRDSPDRLLCPVRMLKFYLNFTDGMQKGSKRLFLKTRGTGEVCSRTISTWLKKLIIFCHDDRLPEVRGHEVRRMSASWAFFTGVKVADILQAGSWARHTTFSSFYLADVQRQVDGRYRCVVASSLPQRS